MIQPALSHAALPIAHAPSHSKAFRMVTMLASGALLGKILGLVRELLMARIFGASLVADSFRGANTAVLMPLIPMQNEGVPAVMIPMLRAWHKEGTAPANLAALCIGLCSIAALIMTAVEMCGSLWVHLIVGRMEAGGQRLVLGFVQIMALWMPASVLLNCLMAAEIALGRSRIAALRPTVLNLSVMTGLLLSALTGKLVFLPLLVAIFLNTLGVWCLWTLWRAGALSLEGVSPGLVVAVFRDFLRRLRPLLSQPLAEQGQVWIERFVASGFAIGTLASIDYARTLTDSALLLVSQPIGMAVLYRGHSADPRAASIAIARPLIAVALPLSIYIAVFAPDIVHLVFARGAFNETAVELTSGALRGIAAGLWATTLGMILLRFLNNAGRNGRAALILAFALAVNAVLNVMAWHEGEVLGYGSAMIGAGEAARGFVLLAGTAIALDIHGTLLRLLAISLPAAALALACCLIIHQAWAGVFTHLVAGGIACSSSIILAGFLLMPAEAMVLAGRFADLCSKARSIASRMDFWKQGHEEERIG
jgi:putative peptidoglycan lipid II flippase